MCIFISAIHACVHCAHTVSTQVVIDYHRKSQCRTMYIGEEVEECCTVLCPGFRCMYGTASAVCTCVHGAHIVSYVAKVDHQSELPHCTILTEEEVLLSSWLVQ